jgi:membrane protein DedA with SNARE-associated domain
MHWNIIPQLSHLTTAGYILLFFSTIIEGAVVVLAATFLLAQKILNPYTVIPIIIVGALAEQVILYWIGRKLGSVRWIAEWSTKVAHRFDERLHSHPLQILIISKYVYGMHRATLIRAGMINLGWKKFIKASFPATLLWLALLGGIGYSLSASYTVVERYLKYAELVPLGFLFILFLIEYMVSKRYKKSLE